VGAAGYREVLDYPLGARLRVRFTTDGREVTDYAVVLLLVLDGTIETVRVYDGAHRRNEMHRYAPGGRKRPAEIFHAGTLGEGMRAAIAAVKHGYLEMIEGWERQ
jgi:hypothetical protein